MNCKRFSEKQNPHQPHPESQLSEVPPVDLKNSHNLKVESYALFGGNF